MDLFEKLNKDGVTIIMITHDENVAKYAKRIIYIIDGRLYNSKEEAMRHAQ